MTAAELKVIADLTVELTRLRQNECKHLCIENLAPEIFGKLVGAYLYGSEDRAEVLPLYRSDYRVPN
jgi:hypothetical protein